MRKSRALRWAVIAFAAHAAFVLLVPLVEQCCDFTLRNLHEGIIDRPAFGLWWALLNKFPRQLGALMWPSAQLLGLKAVSELSWFIWFLLIGAVPFVAFFAALGKIRDVRTAAAR